MAKTDNVHASFRQVNGSWQARLYWGPTDDRQWKSKQGFPTKRQARAWAQKKEDELRQGVEIKKSASFVEYYNKWVETYKAPYLSRGSVKRYRQLGRVLHAYFEDQPINQITRTDYQDFLTKYAASHAPVTVHKTNAFIRAAVRSAILDDLITKDFTMSVIVGGDKKRVRKVEYLNLTEIKALLKHATETINPHYMSRQMIITAIYTGMRLSEIQALTWKDIDLRRHKINISKSWDSVVGEFKPTKNKSSVRTIAINQKLVNMFKQMKKSSMHKMVFVTQDESVPTSTAVNKVLHKLLDELNIKRQGFHFHSLRHSHVALLIANGIDIYTISKRLGHSNTTTTSQIYAYLLDEYRNKTDKEIIHIMDNL